MGEHIDVRWIDKMNIKTCECGAFFLMKPKWKFCPECGGSLTQHIRIPEDRKQRE